MEENKSTRVLVGEVEEGTLYNTILRLCKENGVNFEDMVKKVLKVTTHANTRESLRNEKMSIERVRLLLSHLGYSFSINEEKESVGGRTELRLFKIKK